MGSLILCHKKKARKPYKIAKVQRRLYTIEELCYYLCNNLYLIDSTLLNERLWGWIEGELEMPTLANQLRALEEEKVETERLIMTILQHSSIYSVAELVKLQDVLERLKIQKPVEKKKYMGDNLLANDAIKPAIDIYHSILHAEKEENAGDKFYASVYACLGAAYGRLFQYKEAADMYRESIARYEDVSVLPAYLYASKKAMDGEQYQKLLSSHLAYVQIHEETMELETKMREDNALSFQEHLLEDLKEQYRKNAMGE